MSEMTFLPHNTRVKVDDGVLGFPAYGLIKGIATVMEDEQFQLHPVYIVELDRTLVKMTEEYSYSSLAIQGNLLTKSNLIV